MARATTLFVATDDDLVELGLGVRRALEEPITSVKKSPVIHQVLATASWDPGDVPALVIAARDEPEIPSLYGLGGGAPIPPIVPPASEALEEIAPLRLRALPHAAVVGVTGLELEALAYVLLGATKPPARIVDLLPADGFVDALPTEALAPLAALGDEDVGAIHERWNMGLRATGRRAEPSALMALRALAREAIARGGHVFTHMPQ